MNTATLRVSLAALHEMLRLPADVSIVGATWSVGGLALELIGPQLPDGGEVLAIYDLQRIPHLVFKEFAPV